MTSKFKKAYEKLEVYEGGYVNDPDDKGGETYKGISRKFHPDWCGWELVDEFKHDPALLKDNEHRIEPCVERFYLDEYWRKIKGDMLPASVGEELFEQAVNLGIKRAVKHLQTTLNILAQEDILTIDGVFGAKTLEASDLLFKKIKNTNLAVKILNILQGCYYIDLMKENKIYRKYIGLFNRIKD